MHVCVFGGGRGFRGLLWVQGKASTRAEGGKGNECTMSPKKAMNASARSFGHIHSGPVCNTVTCPCLPCIGNMFVFVHVTSNLSMSFHVALTMFKGEPLCGAFICESMCT